MLHVPNTEASVRPDEHICAVVRGLERLRRGTSGGKRRGLDSALRIRFIAGISPARDLAFGLHRDRVSTMPTTVPVVTQGGIHGEGTLLDWLSNGVRTTSFGRLLSLRQKVAVA